MKLEVLKSRLLLYLEAERKILSGQEYAIGSRRLVRADLHEVRAVIDELSNQIEMLENSTGRIVPVVL